MTEKEWTALLQTYLTTTQVAEQSVVGITGHLDMRCNRRQTMTVPTNNAIGKGLPAFHQELMICDRGTKGCDLIHNDKQALQFARLALERVLELSSGDDPMPQIDPTTKEVT